MTDAEEFEARIDRLVQGGAYPSKGVARRKLEEAGDLQALAAKARDDHYATGNPAGSWWFDRIERGLAGGTPSELPETVKRPFALPVTAVPGCMICGRDLGAEYTVKCTGNSVEWYCPEHANGSGPDVMAKLMESVNNLHQTLHVLYGDSSGGMKRETRTLADGYGGQTTDTQTGVTTSVGRPATRQQRWVGPWENV